jgi:predicted metalloprotease with PDZ domain
VEISFRLLLSALIFVELLAPSAVAQSTDEATEIVRVRDSQLEITFRGELEQARRKELAAWFGRRAEIVARYYGRFPVPRTDIVVGVIDGQRVRGGTTFPRDPPLIRTRVGRDFDVALLDTDWVIVHEMIHLATPSIDDRQNWLSEGLSTYVESISRAQAKDIDAAKMWGGLASGMPQGLPREGDRGLDNTPTWGRTYWGGAMFCLLADVEIRKRTKNKVGLQQALRAILEKSGGFSTDWTIERLIEAGDAATSTTVLADLYGQMKDKPMPVDLPALWRDLGIVVEGTETRLDPKAPLAAVREAITAPVDR